MSYVIHRHHSNSFRNVRVFSIQKCIYSLLGPGSRQFTVGTSGHLIHPSYSILPPAIRSFKDNKVKVAITKS